MLRNPQWSDTCHVGTLLWDIEVSIEDIFQYYLIVTWILDA